MRRKSIVLLTLTITVFALFVIPTYAKKAPYLKASGTIDEYADAYSSYIMGGKWSVKLKGDTVTLRYSYMEYNLDEIENSPPDTIDKFWNTLETTDYTWDGVTLTFSGTRYTKKRWATMEGTYEIVRWESDVTVTVDSTGILVDNLPALGQDFDTLGTTLKWKK